MYVCRAASLTVSRACFLSISHAHAMCTRCTPSIILAEPRYIWFSHHTNNTCDSYLAYKPKQQVTKAKKIQVTPILMKPNHKIYKRISQNDDVKNARNVSDENAILFLLRRNAQQKKHYISISLCLSDVRFLFLRSVSFSGIVATTLTSYYYCCPTKNDSYSLFLFKRTHTHTHTGARSQNNTNLQTNDLWQLAQWMAVLVLSVITH